MSVNVGGVLPPNGRYDHYKGSLTTPALQWGGVSGFVLSQSINMSAAQIHKLEAAAASKARAVHPLNSQLIISPG